MAPGAHTIKQALFLPLLWILAACAGSGGTPAGDRLPVVASFSILGDFVQRVGGDDISLHTLVGPGVDTHTFEPLPADSAAIADADVILAIGLGFEAWLPDLVSAAGASDRRVDLAEEIPPERRILISGMAYDPHVWQDPARASDLIGTIARELTRADPAHASGYQSRAEAYQQELQALDAELEGILAAIPTEHRILVTFHRGLGYFAKRYGFTIVGSVLPESTETAAPAPRELADLIEQVRSSHALAIFGERGEPTDLLETVAAEAGVSQIVLLYSDSLGPAGSEGSSYLAMMRANARAIAAALAP